MSTLTPETLLSAYAQGYFPMAKSRTAKTISWYYPEHRGILPLDHFHVPTSLAKFIKKNPYLVTMDTDFLGTITACADAPRDKDGGTWINDEIIDAYCELHRLGFAHSMEVWDAAGANLVGGLYGVSLGKAFFGESMFSHKTNASKVALVYLVEYLKAKNYTLLDTQYVNDHLLQFGVQEIPREEYLALLKKALGMSHN